MIDHEGKCTCNLGTKCDILNILLDCLKVLHARKMSLRPIFLKYDVKIRAQAADLLTEMHSLDVACAIGKFMLEVKNVFV